MTMSDIYRIRIYKCIWNLHQNSKILLMNLATSPKKVLLKYEIHNYFSHLRFNVIDFAVRDIDEALNETGAGIADNVQYVLAM